MKKTIKWAKETFLKMIIAIFVFGAIYGIYKMHINWKCFFFSNDYGICSELAKGSGGGK